MKSISRSRLCGLGLWLVVLAERQDQRILTKGRHRGADLSGEEREERESLVSLSEVQLEVQSEVHIARCVVGTA